jgi:hypothetical protein
VGHNSFAHKHLFVKVSEQLKTLKNLFQKVQQTFDGILGNFANEEFRLAVQLYSMNLPWEKVFKRRYKKLFAFNLLL